MQRRLIIALVGIALAAVVLVGAGVLVLAQIGARDQTRDEVEEQLEALTDELSESFSGGPGRSLDRLRQAFDLRRLEYVLVDADGTVSVAQSTAVSERGRRPTAFGLTPGDEIDQLDAESLAALHAGESVFAEIDNDGTVSVRGIRLLDLELALVNSQLQDQAEGQETSAGLIVSRNVVTVANQARVWFAVSAAVVLIGSLVAAWALARRLVRPIEEIERVTSSIAAGRFDARVDADGDDELADLGRSVNRMAADLERSKALDQQFLLSVSHDLRTPLTAISGYAEALSDGTVEDSAAAGDVIGNHSARLERLVGDLLDLAKLDANRFQLKLREFDLAVAVGRTVAGLTPGAESHGLALRFEHPGPVPVHADPDRVAQIVANVVENAIKFATTSINASVAVDGTDALIVVSDDGPGIAAEDLPYVFDRLYVAGSQPSRAENPSGMGLAIVRELVTAMGGSVTAAPAVGTTTGTGTTLTVRLTREMTG